ncbi:MAG: SufD family Fe-S cluster assembly protein [Nanopusillaceae archaeon]|nr:SufD family Fe-S cluster assembly protein [Candidatus Aenigmarchaeota archaeon]
MEALVNKFGKYLDVNKIKYREKISRELKINSDKTYLYTKNALYEEKLKIENCNFYSNIRNSIVIRKIFASDSNIYIKTKSNSFILIDEIFSIGNINYFLYGKAKEGYIYLKLTPNSNSYINSNMKLFVTKKLVSIGNIEIKEESINSIANLHKVFYLKDNSILVSIPIINVENDSSKAFHSSKIIRLDYDQKFFLMSKGLNEKNIENLILKYFDSI